jgi:hypothetical protein
MKPGSNKRSKIKPNLQQAKFENPLQKKLGVVAIEQQIRYNEMHQSTHHNSNT